jgi:general secretion pathway protein H
VVSLALPDPASARLEREASRLASLLEGGRAQARALGLVVSWVPGPSAAAAAAAAGRELAGALPDDFHFAGLPPGADLPTRWLEPSRADDPGSQIQVQLVPPRAQVLLGPEPVIDAQRILLRLGDRRLSIGTDGLAPFAVQAASDAAP